jgi:hypothetical protein
MNTRRERRSAKSGVGRSQRLPIFLYFRSQDTTLDTPIRLSGAG